MALVVKDRVRVTSTTSGTGPLSLAGAVAGFQDFSVIGDGNTTYYTIADSASGDWEVGIGTYTAAGTTLSRDTVLQSSNAGSLVNFAATAKDVFVTYPSDRSVYQETAGVIRLAGAFNPSNTSWVNAAFRGQGSFGGAISLIDGSAGYGIWAQDSGASFAIGQGATSGGLTARVFIDSLGNTGFGTITPLARLSVNSGALGQVMTLQGAGAVAGFASGLLGGANTIEITTQDSVGAQASRLMIRGSVDDADIEFYRGARGAEAQSMIVKGGTGYVGIGIDPTTLLHVNGTITANALAGSAATGSGASGTWGISITGNAATVTNGVYQNLYGSYQVSFTSNIDANVNRFAGVYGSYGSGATNTPTNSGLLWNATSNSAASGDGAQIWQDYSSNNLYARQRWGGGWSGWVAMLSANNYNSYSPTLTGGGASGTWGINITGNANTVTNGVYTTGSAMTGLLVGRPSVGNNVNTNNDTGSFSVRSDSSNAASISFHRTGAYAINMGLGTDNVFVIGGWSASANAFRLDGSGNTTILGRATSNSWTTSGRNYSNEWIEFSNHSALYSPINAAHFYPNNGTYGSWKVDGSRNGWQGLEFQGQTTLMMNDDTYGFHRNGVGWRLYNPSGSLYVPGEVQAGWSDERLKTDLRKLGRESLEILGSFNTYRFIWNEKAGEVSGGAYTPGKEEIGLIAQHVQKILPDAVKPNLTANKLNADGTQEETDYLTINYDRITPLLVEGINIHEQEITALKDEIAELRAIVKNLIGG